MAVDPKKLSNEDRGTLNKLLNATDAAWVAIHFALMDTGFLNEPEREAVEDDDIRKLVKLVAVAEHATWKAYRALDRAMYPSGRSVSSYDEEE